MGTINTQSAEVAVPEVLQKFSVSRHNALTHAEAWNEIFLNVLGSQPSGIADTRWDILFSTDEKTGRRALAFATRYIDAL
jgi:hypothetical protein